MLKYILIIIIGGLILLTALGLFYQYGTPAEIEKDKETGDIPKVEEPKKPVSPLLQGEIGVGETKLINGVRVTLNKIIQDSRCPKNATCVWAGNVIMNITLKTTSNQGTLDLASDKYHLFESYRVSIISVKPELTSTEHKPAQSGYRVQFKVEEL